ncbi:MAG TPA: hypothetical protein VFX49_12155, partial [Chloroflexota bacterium]|nr:hypothetical protein [Chloroflexota bacterium]
MSEGPLEHRRFLQADAPLTVAGGALFARIGGSACVDRLVDVLYDRFERDERLRPLFGPELSAERANQKRFFAEWLGGGERYSHSAHAGLQHRHDPLPITRELAGRWLGHFRHALDAAVPAESDRALIFA